MTESIGAQVSDLGRLMRKRFDAAARDYNVTGPQWRVLASIERYPGITQGQLAELLDVEPITTCRMVDRLALAGLVERRSNADDRRIWNLHLTGGALSMLDKVHEIGGAVIDQALAGFTDEEETTLRALMDRMRANLLDERATSRREAVHGRG